MSLEKRYFNWFKPFGPYIVKTTISNEMYETLLNATNKIRKNKKLRKEYDWRDKLAGNIKEEYAVNKILSTDDYKKVLQELIWMAKYYYDRNGEAHNQGNNVDITLQDIKVLGPLWVNIMKSGEWNPSHIHKAHLSCVAFIKIPKEIGQENKKSESSNKSNMPSAGKLQFSYGEDIDFCRTGLLIEPKEKDIYFFPARLKHAVYPFKSNVERMSMSCNFYSDRYESLKF